jgi:hypothetical protein
MVEGKWQAGVLEMSRKNSNIAVEINNIGNCNLKQDEVETPSDGF